MMRLSFQFHVTKRLTRFMTNKPRNLSRTDIARSFETFIGI